MIVVDASVLANVVGDSGADGSTARSALASAGQAAIPDLASVETVAVLRKRWLMGAISDTRFAVAIEDLTDLPLARFPTMPLMRRAFELRHNLTVYDASYVALAEAIGCELLTGHARLAKAPGITCPVRILPAANP